MFQSYFDKDFKFWQYLVLWCLFALLQSVCFLSFIPQPPSIIFIDASAHAFIYAIIGILLWSVIRYGNFGALPGFQRTINYTALAILFIVINVGAGYSIQWLMGDEILKSFQPFIYLRGFISVLVYYAMVQYFRYRLLRETEQETEPETTMPAIASVTTEATESETETTEKLERIAVKSGQKIHVINSCNNDPRHCISTGRWRLRAYIYNDRQVPERTNHEILRGASTDNSVCKGTSLLYR